MYLCKEARRLVIENGEATLTRPTRRNLRELPKPTPLGVHFQGCCLCNIKSDKNGRETNLLSLRAAAKLRRKYGEVDSNFDNDFDGTFDDDGGAIPAKLGQGPSDEVSNGSDGMRSAGLPSHIGFGGKLQD